MKKILLLATLFLNCSLLFGQVIEKGKHILGGTLNAGFSHNQYDTLISSEPSNKSNNLSVGLAPSFGKATSNNTVFGYTLLLNYSHAKAEDLRAQQSGTNNGYGVGGGVFLEKFFPLGKSFSFSAVVPLQLFYSAYKSESFQNGTLTSTGKDKNYGAWLSLYPSLNYSLSKRFLLQLTLNNFVSLNYVHSTNKVEGPNTTPREQERSNFGFGTRVNEQNRLGDVGFAFRYIF